VLVEQFSESTLPKSFQFGIAGSIAKAGSGLGHGKRGLSSSPHFLELKKVRLRK
jgi:hypothetical protein